MYFEAFNELSMYSCACVCRGMDEEGEGVGKQNGREEWDGVARRDGCHSQSIKDHTFLFRPHRSSSVIREKMSTCAGKSNLGEEFDANM